jgi:hypothetical protein
MPLPGDDEAPSATHRGRRFLRDLTRSRLDRLDLSFGLGAALVTLAPLLASLGLGLESEGVLMTFGALNLFLATLPRPQLTRRVVAATAIVSNAVAFGAGSLVAELPATAEVVGAAVGITVALVAARNARWENLGTLAAVMFVLGIGLPVEPPTVLPSRTLFVLFGGVVAFGGWWALIRWLPPLRGERPSAAPPPSGPSPPVRSVLPYGAAVGVTAALGLAIGLHLNFARDYWIMLTIVVALRPELSSTLAFSAARVLGTIIGATAAFFLTSFTGDLLILLPGLALSATLTFATRPVNATLYAVWVTLFLIGLLNLVYAGGPALAVTRVVDTLIGGALALAAALVLSLAIGWRGGHARPA